MDQMLNGISLSTVSIALIIALLTSIFFYVSKPINSSEPLILNSKTMKDDECTKIEPATYVEENEEIPMISVTEPDVHLEENEAISKTSVIEPIEENNQGLLTNIDSASTDHFHVHPNYEHENEKKEVVSVSVSMTTETHIQRRVIHKHECEVFTDSESSGCETEDERRTSIEEFHSTRVEEVTLKRDGDRQVMQRHINEEVVTTSHKEEDVKEVALKDDNEEEVFNKDEGEENVEDNDDDEYVICDRLEAEEPQDEIVRETESEKVEWDMQSLVRAGVPEEDVAGLLELCGCVGAVQGECEPLKDPITLLRFFNSREKSLKDALEMYTETVAWRSNFGLYDVLATFGDMSVYNPNKSGDLKVEYGLSGEWDYYFPRSPSTPMSKLISNIKFYHMLSERAEYDAPIAIWRLGSIDFAGIVREGLEDDLRAGFLSHLEEMLQLGRAASSRHRRLVRCRLIIDGTGLGLWMLPYLPVLKLITGLGKAYFPETTASATIVNAPWVFARLFGAISPMLTPVMRAKVCILDSNFETGLCTHSGVDIATLPSFLGGNLPDSACPSAEKVPKGAKAFLR